MLDTSADSNFDSGSSKNQRRRNIGSGGLHILKQNITYPDADDMFRLVERELGLGEQMAFYSSSGWGSLPCEHPDLATWLLGQPSDADESQ